MENLDLIIGLFAVLILVAIAFVYRRWLSIFLKKLIYGSYSYSYLSSLPENILAMMHPPAIRYDPWYVLKGLERENILHYQTSGRIDFQDFQIGKSYPDFLKKEGNPYYLTISEDKNDLIKFVVFGYKQRIYNYEAVILYYFWNHMFVAGQYQIKREKQKVDRTDLASKLMAKYFVKEGNINQNEFEIRDKEGNVAFFEDNGFNVEISLINPALIERLKSPGSLSFSKNKINLEAASVTF